MQKNNPEQLSELERTYYRETWGFDPVTDRKVLRFGKNFLLSIVGQVEEDIPEEGQKRKALETKDTGSYYYEDAFSLDADPGLQNIGVVIAARIEMYEDGTFHNYIVFRQGPRLTRVDCVHTIICQYPSMSENLSFPKDLLGEMSSTESRPAILPPWEHFAALKSYVGGIAATGLKNILIATYAGEDSTALLLPFGFNALMQKQVLSALRALSPAAAKAIAQDVIGQLLEIKSGEWIRANYEELDEIWDIETVGRSSADLFIPLDAALHSPEFRISAEVSSDTHPDVLNYLQQNPATAQSNTIRPRLPTAKTQQESSIESFRVSIEAKIASRKQGGYVDTKHREDSEIDRFASAIVTDSVVEQNFIDGSTIVYKRSRVRYISVIVVGLTTAIIIVTALYGYTAVDLFFLPGIILGLSSLGLVGAACGGFIGPTIGFMFSTICVMVIRMSAGIDTFILPSGWVGFSIGGAIGPCMGGIIHEELVRLQLSTAGLQYRTIFGTRFHPWSEITFVEAIRLSSGRSEIDYIKIGLTNAGYFRIFSWKELVSKDYDLDLNVVSMIRSFKKMADRAQETSASSH